MDNCYSKTLVVILLCVVYISGYGRQQQGYVKTAGSAHSNGVPLSDVTIILENSQSYLSSRDGTFTLQLPNGKEEGDGFIIKKVFKKDYELLDASLLSRPYVFSSNVPIEIIMISCKELANRKKQVEKQSQEKGPEGI